jgi:hypothetical protein
MIKQSNSKNKKFNRNIILGVLIITVITAIAIGSWFIFLYMKNSNISGTWKSVNSSAQYQFNSFGKYNYYEDPSNKKCDLWNCNYDEGNYEINEKDNKKILVLHFYGVGTYSTEFTIDKFDNNDFLILKDSNTKFQKAN